MINTLFVTAKNRQDCFKRIAELCNPLKTIRVRIDEADARTLLQNDKIHAMLGDIAEQSRHLNRVFDIDGWKRLCVKQFADDCIENKIERLYEYWTKNKVELVPSLNGSSVVALGQQTRDMPKYVASGLIEWLYVYGAQNDITWTNAEELAEWEARLNDQS